MENFNKDVLEEFKNVLNSDKIGDPDSISLYDIKTLVNSKYDILKEIEKKSEKKINKIIKSKIKKNCASSLYSFNNNDVIGLGFSSSEFGFPSTIWFHKINGDLCIKSSENTMYDDKILLYAGDVLSELCDVYNKFKDFFEQKSSDIKSVNSNLFVEITNQHTKVFKKQQVVISDDNKEENEEKEFEIRWSNYLKNYNYKCKSNNLINTIGNNEDEIFKRVFVRIEDCPKWMQKQLYEIRKYQLKNPNEKTLYNKPKENYEILMDEIKEFLSKDIVNCENSLVEVINLYDLYNIINDELEELRKIHIDSKIQKKLNAINNFLSANKKMFSFLCISSDRCSIFFVDNKFAKNFLTVYKDNGIDEIYFNREQNKENKLVYKFINKNYDLIFETLNMLERYKKLIDTKNKIKHKQVFTNDLFEIFLYFDEQGVTNIKININRYHKLSNESLKKWHRRENIDDFINKNKNKILKRIPVNLYELNDPFKNLYDSHKAKQYQEQKVKKLRLTK